MTTITADLPRRLAAATLWARASAALPPLVLALAATWVTAASGGYFPATWGWSATALAWIGMLAITLRRSIAFSILDGVALAGFAGLSAWTFLSFRWSDAPPQTMLEGQRSLVYLTGVAATLLVLRRRSVPVLLGSLLTGIAAIGGWALLTRLLPDRVGTFDAFSGYRLTEPVGYWNALGILVAVGGLLGLGLAARAGTHWGRASAAATVPVMFLTLYFTFSRGAWIAVVIGILLTIALDPHRLQLIAAFLAAGLPATLVVAVGSQYEGLVRNDATILDAADEGHGLFALLVVCMVLAAVAVAALSVGARRVSVPALVRDVFALTLVVAACAVLAATFSRYGSPVQIVHGVHRSFLAPPTKGVVNLNDRLFTFSSNGRTLLWQAARDQWRSSQLVGSGAGSYEQHWLLNRDRGMKVRDAHSLYLETLAELGLIGLVLLVLALGAPLVAAVRARAVPLVPAAAGAYGAFLAHAAVDWDWEMAGLTLTALLMAAALLVAARRGRPRAVALPLRSTGLVVLAAVGVAAFVGLLGNIALDRSVAAAGREDWASSISWASRAERLQPWSSQPWRRMALAQPTAAAARPLFLEAIERDPNDWELWLELTWASTGADRAQALAEALRLNRWSPELGHRINLDKEAAAAAGAKKRRATP